MTLVRKEIVGRDDELRLIEGLLLGGSRRVVLEGEPGIGKPTLWYVHLIRNGGTVGPRSITVQLIPVGATRRIDAPAPGNCPF